MCSNKNENQWTSSLISGGMAGLTVDFALYPLDTIKTRVQSQNGFWKSGGFSNIYKGIGFALSGSIPNAAAFFVTYDTIKTNLNSKLPSKCESITHMIAAVSGEVAGCTIRMPIEVIKQRSQATNQPSMSILRSTYREGGFRGLYRGYLTTVCREIPFAIIQFPVWEQMKLSLCKWKQVDRLNFLESAGCGAASGAIAGAITTPLDVAKTRIILAERNDPNAKGNMNQVIRSIYLKEGVSGLFSGVLPRVMWISIGGAIFLGGYDVTKNFLDSKSKSKTKQ